MDRITVTEEQLYDAIDECILRIITDIMTDRRFKEYPREQGLITESCTLVRKGLERYHLWKRLEKRTQDLSMGR